MLANAIDYWCNAFTPDRQAAWQQAIDNQGLGLKVYRDGDEFCEPAAMIDRLDTTGFATIILPTTYPPHDPAVDSFENVEFRPTEVAALASAHPGRFVGVWSVDPTRGDDDVAYAEELLAQPWCVGLHNHTHSWDRTFDHPDFLPYYELCAKHDVPFVMQAGASGGDFPHECGHPAGIEQPAQQFPSVRFVLSHTGAPWVSETIAMAHRFANVYLGTATWPPRRWNDELRAFMTGDGQHKVLYGSGFPTSGHVQAVRQLTADNFDAEVLRSLTSANARTVFSRLPEEP